jgi:hypothetical protein
MFECCALSAGNQPAENPRDGWNIVPTIEWFETGGTAFPAPWSGPDMTGKVYSIFEQIYLRTDAGFSLRAGTRSQNDPGYTAPRVGVAAGAKSKR